MYIGNVRSTPSKENLLPGQALNTSYHTEGEREGERERKEREREIIM